MSLPGIKPDLMKVSAVVEISNPTDNAGIRCIYTSFSAAHIPKFNVSTITVPL